MFHKYEQSELWIEGQGDVPCLEVRCTDEYTVTCGYLVPANNQFIALNKTSKCSLLPAKGERILVTYILTRNEHIASYQHVMLIKCSLPVQHLHIHEGVTRMCR